MSEPRFLLGNCLEVIGSVPQQSVDAVICDPPYPGIERDYGKIGESEWMTMMEDLLFAFGSIMKPDGSVLFILQGNSLQSGSMASWIYQFESFCAKYYNIVQDLYWWNYTALPSGGCNQGLCRSSVKRLVWVGKPDCYRNQEAALWLESAANAAERHGNGSIAETSKFGLLDTFFEGRNLEWPRLDAGE